MVPIYACSVVALAVFLRKLFELRRARATDMAWLEPVIRHLEEGDLGAAAAACADTAHPAARAVEAALRVAKRRPDRIEAEATRVGSIQVQRAERHLGLLSFIAQVAPLLGLLGTVVGMVRLFLDLESSPGVVDAAQLSAGIWQALLTTAAGLIVAVPTLAGYSYLAWRSDAFRLSLHDAVERALTAAPARGARAPQRAGPAEVADAV
jgi:biopolymer transport protein ExbB